MVQCISSLIKFASLLNHSFNTTPKKGCETLLPKCHDRISNNDGKTTFSPTIAESRTSQDAQKRQRAFFRPPCVPNPKIAEIHLLRHCRDRDVMFGRRDTEHKAMEVYRYYRSLRDSLSDSTLESLESLKSLKSFRSTPLS